MKVNVNSQSKLNLMQRSLGIKFNICRRNGNLQEIRGCRCNENLSNRQPVLFELYVCR